MELKYLGLMNGTCFTDQFCRGCFDIFPGVVEVFVCKTAVGQKEKQLQATCHLKENSGSDQGASDH